MVPLFQRRPVLWLSMFHREDIIVKDPVRSRTRPAVALERGEPSPTLEHAVAKVPEVVWSFWILKIAATTLGETGGDSVTMSWLGETTPHPMPYGYLIGT